jgi:hypothetical protein
MTENQSFVCLNWARLSFLSSHVSQSRCDMDGSFGPNLSTSQGNIGQELSVRRSSSYLVTLLKVSDK